jgi:hypothetical protein
VATLLTAVDVSATSNVYWVMSTARALAYSQLLTTGGYLLNPGLGPKGGPTLSGITILTSDSTPVNRSIFVVAGRLCIAADPIDLRISTQSTLQLDSARLTHLRPRAPRRSIFGLTTS